MNSKKILSNDEIIDQLLTLLNVENDNKLAEALGVTRQQIRQFRNSLQTRLPQIIITKILGRYGALKSDIEK